MVKGKYPWTFDKVLKFKPIRRNLRIGGLEIDYFAAEHSIFTLGFIFKVKGKKVVYAPDCCGVKQRNKIEKSDILIIDSTKDFYKGNSKGHFSVKNSVKFAKEIGAGKTYLTHLNHHQRHADLRKKVRKMGNFEVAYDGLEIEI